MFQTDTQDCSAANACKRTYIRWHRQRISLSIRFGRRSWSVFVEEEVSCFLCSFSPSCWKLSGQPGALMSQPRKAGRFWVVDLAGGKRLLLSLCCHRHSQGTLHCLANQNLIDGDSEQTAPTCRISLSFTRLSSIGRRKMSCVRSSFWSVPLCYSTCLQRSTKSAWSFADLFTFSCAGTSHGRSRKTRDLSLVLTWAKGFQFNAKQCTLCVMENPLGMTLSIKESIVLLLNLCLASFLVSSSRSSTKLSLFWLGKLTGAVFSESLLNSIFQFTV